MMPKDLPKGVSKDKDRHGNWRFYFRAPGRPKVRLREAPGTKAFDDEVACARIGVPYEMKTDATDERSPSPSSFRWLCIEYFASPEFKATAPRTQSQRRRILEDICKKDGRKPFALMERRHVIKYRNERQETPAAANHVVKVISALFSWAIENDHARKNPAAGIKRLEEGDGFHTWTIDEVAKYLDFHGPGTKARKLLFLAMFTGFRRQTLAIVGRQHIRLITNAETGQTEKWLCVQPQKTRKSSGVMVEIPLLPILEQALEDGAPTDLTFMTTEYGKPFSEAGLGGKMRQWCDDAGLTHCSLHGLRKAGAVIAAENGATPSQMQSIFGWTTLQQAERYTRQADRRRLAAGGIQSLMPAQIANKIVPLQSPTSKGGTKSRKSVKKSIAGK